MKKNLDNKSLLKYSRQIILKDVGVIGQKKIINSKVLVIGAGGLGSPVIDLLARAGVCLLYTSPSPRDATLSRMPSSA